MDSLTITSKQAINLIVHLQHSSAGSIERELIKGLHFVSSFVFLQKYIPLSSLYCYPEETLAVGYFAPSLTGQRHGGDIPEGQITR